MTPAILRAVLPDGIEESPTDQRLGKDVIKAGFGGTLRQHDVMKARYHDRVSRPASLPEMAQDGETVDIGHPIIEDYTVGLVCSRIGQQRTTCRVAVHLIAARSQQQLNAAPHARIVVRDKDGVAAIAPGTDR